VGADDNVPCMAAGEHLGGCRCGAVRYRVSGGARHPCFCHCESCRRASGAAVVAWGTFEHANFQLTRGRLAEYHSSPPVTRGFCAACGTALTYRHRARADDVDVTLASLDEPARLAPRMHIWVSDKLPWMSIDDGLPQYATTVSGEAP
jgi:hypothetical protein